ncbi:hypothetical protein [Plebeiibacterium sediminum]|uniref:Uncharacterized protein n=1 Tax=Plebeiibacterium sediminum TaxID=2992112 RepID=A0AAE3SIT2_9BACT|nr:hypothetical protein [Plebeiobacterium sediminum]MCW3789588.1 hypothetical protein [Plebeiobacterium sediminum]
MGNKESYDQMLEEAKALSAEKIQKFNMPIEAFLQEAEDLNKWSLHDKEKLTETGLPETIFNRLGICTGALREAESIWHEDDRIRNEAEKQWREEKPNGFKFRDDLLHSFRYAYRKDPALLNSVSSIAKGSNIPDMIQDLNDLAVLGRNNLEPLLQIGFEEEQLATAADMSTHLADLRAIVNGDKYNPRINMQIRDAMYTLLKQCVDEIRDCGKFVFRNDPIRLNGYRSQYTKIQNKKYKNK